MIYYVAGLPYSAELYHYGVKGQQWGNRKYQNLDGSLTSAGRAHYGVGPAKDDENDSASTISKIQSMYSKLKDKNTKEELDYIIGKVKAGTYSSEEAIAAANNAVELDKERVEYLAKQKAKENKKKANAKQKSSTEAQQKVKEAEARSKEAEEKANQRIREAESRIKDLEEKLSSMSSKDADSSSEAENGLEIINELLSNTSIGSLNNLSILSKSGKLNSNDSISIKVNDLENIYKKRGKVSDVFAL